MAVRLSRQGFRGSRQVRLAWAMLFGGLCLGPVLAGAEPPLAAPAKLKPVPPDPGATVMVTGRKLSIPPPPVNSGDAAIRSVAVLVEIRNTVAFLDTELKRLGVAQSQELAQLKADPGKASAGMDTPLFAALYRSSKDPELGQLEAAYRTAVIAAQGRLASTVDRGEALQGLSDPSFWMKDKVVEEVWINGVVPKMNPVDRDLKEQRRRVTTGLSASALDAFLLEYQPIAATYSQALEAHLGRLEVQLRIPESEFTASTRVLARLLQLQFYKSYRALSLRHQALWEAAATVGVKRQKAELDSQVDAGQ